jgi:hypothetical protein
MNRYSLPLQQPAVSFKHQGNTLIIKYHKPPPIIEKEKKAKFDRTQIKAQNPPRDGDVECNPQ